MIKVNIVFITSHSLISDYLVSLAGVLAQMRGSPLVSLLLK